MEMEGKRRSKEGMRKGERERENDEERAGESEVDIQRERSVKRCHEGKEVGSRVALHISIKKGKLCYNLFNWFYSVEKATKSKRNSTKGRNLPKGPEENEKRKKIENRYRKRCRTKGGEKTKKPTKMKRKKYKFTKRVKRKSQTKTECEFLLQPVLHLVPTCLVPLNHEEG